MHTKYTATIKNNIIFISNTWAHNIHWSVVAILNLRKTFKKLPAHLHIVGKVILKFA